MPLPIIDTRPLFRPVTAEIVALLRSLSPADWERPHGAQIREAVGAGPFTDGRWLRAVLEIALHALPHAYRDVPARRLFFNALSPDAAEKLVRLEGDATIGRPLLRVRSVIV